MFLGAAAGAAAKRELFVNQPYQPPASEPDRLRAQVALSLVAARTGVPPEAMTLPGRMRPAVCRARWLALYLAHVAYGWALERVSHAFAVNRTTAGKACRWAEDERDRPEVDRLLDELEGITRQLFDTPRLDLA